MQQIVQCVPNISEGRNREIVEAVVDVVRKTPDVKLLDWSSDSSQPLCHHLVGTAAGVEEAAFAVCAKAAELIDMTTHTGEHPRMGARDVVPFIPIQGISMDECIELATG